MRDGFSEEWLMWTTFATETMRRVIPQGLPAVQAEPRNTYVVTAARFSDFETRFV